MSHGFVLRRAGGVHEQLGNLPLQERLVVSVCAVVRGEDGRLFWIWRLRELNGDRLQKAGLTSVSSRRIPSWEIALVVVPVKERDRRSHVPPSVVNFAAFCVR